MTPLGLINFLVLRWVWPLTGWWSRYRWIACAHSELDARVVDHGGIREAVVSCKQCGVEFRNAREARSAGILLQVEAARRRVLDAIGVDVMIEAVRCCQGRCSRCVEQARCALDAGHPDRCKCCRCGR